MPNSADSAEAYIVNRYKLWERWPTRYGYKHAKGARIAAIIRDTGGAAPLALEIGVGPGGVAAAVSRTGTKVLGIDLSPDALIRAREHCARENVALLRGSGFSLPFADGSLPLVYASQVLHLFNDPDRLAIMQEAHRVLQPGGRFLFDMKNVWSHPVRFLRSDAARRRRNFPSESDLVTLLRRAGFTRVDSRPGVFPMLGARVPNIAPLRRLAHTRFFVASR